MSKKPRDRLQEEANFQAMKNAALLGDTELVGDLISGDPGLHAYDRLLHWSVQQKPELLKGLVDHPAIDRQSSDFGRALTDSFVEAARQHKDGDPTDSLMTLVAPLKKSQYWQDKALNKLFALAARGRSPSAGARILAENGADVDTACTVQLLVHAGNGPMILHLKTFKETIMRVTTNYTLPTIADLLKKGPQ